MVIAAVHVAAQARGQGMGSRLMDHAEANGGRAFNTRSIRIDEQRMASRPSSSG
jgi:predicted GNAT family N-acyltransferase